MTVITINQMALIAILTVSAVSAILVLESHNAYAEDLYTNVDTLRFLKVPADQATSSIAGGSIDVYYHPLPTSAKVTSDKIRIYESTGGSLYSILVNPATPDSSSDLTNPFAEKQVRYALNHLIDRNKILSELFGGRGEVLYSNYHRNDPNHSVVSPNYDKVDFAYNQNRAKSIIESNLAASGYKIVDGKWKDPADKDVEIRIFIRTDDPVRMSVGEYLKSELEALGFTVTEIRGDLSTAFATVYNSDPGKLGWHLYTEAYAGSPISKNTDSLLIYYAPYSGSLPGYANATIDADVLKLVRADYANAAEREQLVVKAHLAGIQEAVRIFFATQNTRHAASSDVDGLITVHGEGIASRYSTINAHNPDKDSLNIGVLHLTQGAWNPVGGFTDSYTNTIWDVIRDPSSDTDPTSGELIPIRTSWTVDKTSTSSTSVDTEHDVLRWNTEDKTWTTIQNGGTTYKSKVTVDMSFGKWHNGQPMDMEDVMYGLYFSGQWGSSSSADETFDYDYSRPDIPSLLKGVRIVDDDTIEVYTDYWHLDDSEIASNSLVWSTIPWEIYAAMEETVINGGVAFSGKDKDGGKTGWLSLYDSNDAESIRDYLQSFKNGTKLPRGLYDVTTNWIDRYDASIKWIDEKNHAVISNGPFYLDSATANSITLKPFADSFIIPDRVIQTNIVDAPDSQGFYQTNIFGFDGTQSPGSQSSSRSGGGGGGGGGGGRVNIDVHGGASDIYLKSVSWDCNEGLVTVIAGPDTEGLSVHVMTSELGMHQSARSDESVGAGYVKFTSPMHHAEDYVGVSLFSISGRSMYSINESFNIKSCVGTETYQTPLDKTLEDAEKVSPDVATRGADESFDATYFIDPTKDPQSYIDRYNNEESYREWFHKNYPDMTIYEAVGMPESAPELEVEPEPTPEPEVDPEPVMEPGSDLEPHCGPGAVLEDGICKVTISEEGGGCLVATAVYGTELAPQIQFLREIRDTVILETASGSAFMSGFNQIYYSFSPTISDLQREHPFLQGVVRAFITPGIVALNIMTLSDGTEASVILYGILSLAALAGIYVAIPGYSICLFQKRLNQYRR